jgi:hypothetical protein
MLYEEFSGSNRSRGMRAAGKRNGERVYEGFIAMYATGNGVRSASPAHFDWFG